MSEKRTKQQLHDERNAIIQQIKFVTKNLDLLESEDLQTIKDNLKKINEVIIAKVTL